MNDRINIIKPRKVFANFSELLKPRPVLKTPVEPLNKIISGVPLGELTVISADGGEGKTSLACQIGLFHAQQETPVGMFSLEMSAAEVGRRMAAGALGYDARRLEPGTDNPFTEAELKTMNKRGSDELGDVPFYIDDRPGLSAETIAETSKVWVKNFGIRLILIDYLGLIEGDGENRQELTGKACRTFKAIAKTHDVPVILLVQQNRSRAHRVDQTPLKSDLRDSGQIEQHSDVIVMFQYPHAPADEVDDVRECHMHVKKNRNGRTGIAYTQFNRSATRFETLNQMDLIAETEKREHRKAEAEPPAPSKKPEWKRPPDTEETE